MFRLFSCAVLMLGVARGLPLDSCSRQEDCINMNFVEQPAGTCKGTCQWQVCLQLSYGPKCVKAGAISHTCIKSPSVCGGGAFTDATTIQKANPDNGFQQCQTGSPGQKLYFLLKDGGSCSDSVPQISGNRLGLVAGASMSCSPTRSESDTCTGNGVGKECLWEVVVPPCDIYNGVIPAASGATASGSASGATATGSASGATATGSASGATATGSASGATATTGVNVTDVEGDLEEDVITSGLSTTQAIPVPKCPLGTAGYNCEQQQCNNIVGEYPDMKVLNSGFGPTCTLAEAAKAGGLDNFKCKQPVATCDVLVCEDPVPEGVMDGIRASCTRASN